MKVGTKSILWGVHAFWFHPITVWLAWKELYGFPDWKETICIFVHDWGYVGSQNMDGEEGEKHPEFGAKLVSYISKNHHSLCLYHSRHYARMYKEEPSKLCWADKLSIKYDPEWFYLLRATLSGEIKEYRKMANDAKIIPLNASNHEWFKWAAGRFIVMGYQQSSEGVPFQKEV